jgi:hypothetical protein
MRKGRAPRQQNRKQNKEAMQRLSKIHVKKEECMPPKKNIPEVKKTQEDKFRRSASQRRSSIPRYQRFFYGHCFNCANFGHKVVNCRAYAKNRSNYAGYLNNSYPRKSYEAYNRNQNSFGSLSNEVECYKCHNYGHIARDCRSMMDTSMRENIDIRYKKIWKRKQEQVKEEQMNEGHP